MAANSAPAVCATAARPVTATMNQTRSPTRKPAMKAGAPRPPWTSERATTAATPGPGNATASAYTAQNSQAVERHAMLMSRVTLVVAVMRRDLAAKHVVRPADVHEDDRQQEQRADEQERLRRRCRRGLPQRMRIRHDIGKKTDAEPEIAHGEKSHRTDEREVVGIASQR